MFPVTEREPALSLLGKLRLRRMRQRLLLRAWRKRRQLIAVSDRTAEIGESDILCFATMRNELLRLPEWLAHHRALGISHFLIVLNQSDDGSAEYLSDCLDVSIWRTETSYRLSRFGMDWLTWLQIRFGHGHWCLTLDADELLLIPHHGERDLGDLTKFLDVRGAESFGATMIDLYPDRPLDAAGVKARKDALESLTLYDADTYRARRHWRFDNLWIQGGPRERMFFRDRPGLSPTLNKQMLVKWNRRYAYVSSTHQLLPRRLNRCFPTQADRHPWGALLHTKFTDGIGARTREEIGRDEHFENSAMYRDYYEALTQSPHFRFSGSRRFTGWAQLEKDGLIWRGDWL